MSEWRARLARGAWLAMVVGLLFTLGYDLYARRLLFNPPDPALASRFRAHRTEFAELAGLERDRLWMVRHGFAAGDSSRYRSALARREERWRGLVRDLRLDGVDTLLSDSLVYLAASAWYPRTRLDDVKGYVYSIRPLADLVQDLDAVAVRPRRAGEVLRWHRHLEGEWYLFREVGGGETR